jgi:hypothetical protein
VEGPAVPSRHASLKSAHVGFSCSMSQIFFSLSPPLDLLFPIDSVTDILIAFEPNESIALVCFCETRNQALSMFLNPTLDAVGHSAVENVRSAGDDVNLVVMLSFAHLKTHSLSKVRTAGPSTTLRSGRDDKGEEPSLHLDSI